MEFSLADRWIEGQYQQTIKAYREALDTYRFDIAAQLIYEFTWNQFCGWYLELTKPVLFKGNEVQQRGTRYTLLNILESLLRLMHPITPYITETIWRQVAPLAGKAQASDSIMLQSIPEFDASRIDEAAVADLEWLKQFILAIRNIRGEMDISPNKPLNVLLKNASSEDLRRLNDNAPFLASLAKLESTTALAEGEAAPASATAILGDMEILIPMAGLIDKDAELARIGKQLEKLEKELAKVSGKLSNQKFVANAPEQVIAKERAKLDEMESAKAKLVAQQETIAAL